MKSVKSIKSQRSIKSATSNKSMKTNVDSKRGDVGGEFIDFANILPVACSKFRCPKSIAVKKESQRDEFYKAIKYGDPTTKRKKLSIMPTPAAIVSQQSEVKITTASKSGDDNLPMDINTLVVIAVYDTYNCLSEIVLNSMRVPRTLMQVIGILVPYFQNLTTLTVRRCRIDSYIIYEISKMLDFSCLTSICLDESPVLEQNYAVLFTEQCSLKSVSLCRCKLNDDACKPIADKLHHGANAESLQLLNLSSNHITDIGAKYFSDALRTNRRLRYLNLADNRITDVGASSILGVLIEFPMTYDEIMNKKQRYLKYLKCKQTLYLKYLNECDVGSFDESRSSAKRKKSRKDKDSKKLYTDDDIKARAEMLASEILGQFVDPFDPSSIKRYNNYCYCIGNMTLSYLNLSYNNLSYLIIKKLENVVNYQNFVKKSNQSGLIKVVVDGNNLPMCKELTSLNDSFARVLKSVSAKFDMAKRRRLSRIV